MKPQRCRLRRCGGAQRWLDGGALMVMMMIMLSTTTLLQWIPPVESLAAVHHTGFVARPVNSVPPVPGLPDNTDYTSQRTSRATVISAKPSAAPLLTSSYLPAVMQAVAYYVELLQYEIVDMTTVEPPFTKPSSEDDPTGSVPSTAGTYKMPVSTTYRPRPPTSTTARPLFAGPTAAHAPGYYAPIVAPSSSATTTNVAVHTDENRAEFGTLPLLSVSNQEFFNWFLQSKEVEFMRIGYDDEVSPPSWSSTGAAGGAGATSASQSPSPSSAASTAAAAADAPQQQRDDLQYLHQLPSALLHDIRNERYEQPAQLDVDNVNAFRKVYDDFYGSRQPMTGRKRIPPTKPYVQMLMLYDLLKRDARRLMLNTFEGYTVATLNELNETARFSAERQLYTLFQRMIDRGDVDKDDIKTRCQAIMIDLINPSSITAKAMRYIPPLQFRL